MCNCRKLIPLRLGCLFRVGIRLASSVTEDMTNGALLELEIFDNEERSGSAVRTIDSDTNPTQWDFDAATSRYICTLTAAQVDGTPALIAGETYYANVNATWGTETDPQRIAEFELEVLG